MANNSTLKKIQIDNVTYDIGGGASVSVQNNSALVINNSGTDISEIANTIAANPSAEGTESLNKIKIGDVVYVIAGGSNIVEKQFDTSAEDITFTENFTEEEFDKIYNDKATIIGKYGDMGFYVFSVELAQTMGTTSLISCYCNTMPNGASLSLGIRNDDGVITYTFEEVPKSTDSGLTEEEANTLINDKISVTVNDDNTIDLIIN